MSLNRATITATAVKPLARDGSVKLFRQQARLTEARRTLLELIAEYHYLTTKQIWKHLYNGKKLQQTQRDLAVMRDELKLIRSFGVEPEIGRASEYCWQLTRQGAEDELGIEYSTNLARKPTSRQRIYFQEVRLNLERQVTQVTLWKLIKPQAYNRNQPKPIRGDFTPQYEMLIKGLSYLQGLYRPGAVDLSGTPLEYSTLINAVQLSGLHSIQTSPLQIVANDYVAYLDTTQEVLVVPLIVCPPGAGREFWKERAELYHPINGGTNSTSSVSHKLMIFAVLTSGEQVKAQEASLNKYGFEVATVGKLAKALSWAKAELETRKRK